MSTLVKILNFFGADVVKRADRPAAPTEPLVIKTIDHAFWEAVRLSRDWRNDWSLEHRVIKAGEECGELMTAVLAHLDKLPNKVMKEPPSGEAADLILCAIDTLSAIYPDLTQMELLNLLVQELARKLPKWEKVISDRTAIYAARNSTK